MLFCEYLHGLVARHGSHVVFCRLFVCFLKFLSLKQFLEKETNTIFRVYRRYLQVNHIASGIKICRFLDRFFGGSLIRTQLGCYGLRVICS